MDLLSMLELVRPVRGGGALDAILGDRLRTGRRRAQDGGAEAWEISLLQNILKHLQSACRENRGRTGPEDICGFGYRHDPLLDSAGNPAGYSKLVLLLTGEFSSSAADAQTAGAPSSAPSPRGS